MTETESTDTGARIRLILAGFLVAIAVLGLVDYLLDAPMNRTAAHGLVELLYTAVCLGGAIYLGLSWHRSAGSLARVRAALESRQAERDAWRARAEVALKGLSEAIDAQLTEWDLTPAERDVAFLLLKGYSHREAATLCRRSERTVRQHAVSIYRKSGLSGRAELSAFFLEDLLVPSAGESGAGTPSGG